MSGKALLPIDDNVKMTLTLGRRSLDFLKSEAASAACPASG